MKTYVTTIHFTNQDRFLKNHGHDLWDNICYTFAPGETFSLTTACRLLKTKFTKTQLRKYIKLVLHNILAEHAILNTNTCPIKQINLQEFELV